MDAFLRKRFRVYIYCVLFGFERKHIFEYEIDLVANCGFCFNFCHFVKVFIFCVFLYFVLFCLLFVWLE